jgi:CheY-like chemotaxis protein
VALDSDVRLEIRDTGIGIGPEFLPYIFDLFRQADPSSSRAEGGLGLGLALVKQFVELHGGAVWAESAGLGHGATFYVQLALCPGVSTESADAGETAEPEPALNGVRILAVDDNQDTRQFLALALERFGASVATADSARQAMEVLESFRPQVLISDLAMPQEDGYALIRRVREHERGNQSRVPAIALSAYSRIEDQRTALQAGFDVHVAKPVQPAALAATVARLLKKVG